MASSRRPRRRPDRPTYGSVPSRTCRKGRCWRVRAYLPARNRPGHLRHLMLKLEEPAGGASTDLIAPLEQILQTVKRRGMLVLISDLLAPIEALEKNLSTLRASGHDVLLFHTLDPAELNFNFDKAVMFRDTENARQLFIDPVTARKDYLKNLEAHNSLVHSFCQRHGIGYFRLGTDRPLELALFDFLRERQQKGKATQRAAAHPRSAAP